MPLNDIDCFLVLKLFLREICRLGLNLNLWEMSFNPPSHKIHFNSLLLYLFAITDIYFDEPNTCVNQPEWNVVQTSRGYEITIEDLPMFYYGFMIGPKGTKKKKIEQSCDVSVAFPTKGEQGNVSKFLLTKHVD